MTHVTEFEKEDVFIHILFLSVCVWGEESISGTWSYSCSRKQAFEIHGLGMLQLEGTLSGSWWQRMQFSLHLRSRNEEVVVWWAVHHSWFSKWGKVSLLSLISLVCEMWAVLTQRAASHIVHRGAWPTWARETPTVLLLLLWCLSFLCISIKLFF